MIQMTNTVITKISTPFAAVLGVLISLRSCEIFNLPVAILAVMMVGMLGIGFQKKMKVCWSLVAFVAVYGISLLLNLHPATMIRVQRFIAFAIGMAALSPLITSQRFIQMRSIVFLYILRTLSVMVAMSFIIWIYCMVVGVELGSLQFYKNGFKGVFEIGMGLSPASAIIAIYAFNLVLSKSRRWVKYLGAALFLIACTMTLAGGSRASLAGCGLALVVNAFWCRQRIGELLGRVKYGKVLIPAVVLIVLAAGVPYGIKTVNYKMGRAMDRGTILNSRGMLWKARITEFESSPLIGIGYAREFPKETYEKPALYGATSPDLTIIEPGSSYLSLLSYGGIIGFGTFVLFLVQLFRRNNKAGSVSDISHNTICGQSEQGCKYMLWSMLLFLGINGITEGWLLFSGSLMFSIFWLVISQLYIKRKGN